MRNEGGGFAENIWGDARRCHVKAKHHFLACAFVQLNLILFSAQDDETGRCPKVC